MHGFYKIYKDYFEYQNICHPELLHNRETGNTVFEIVPIEDAFGDFRSQIAEKTYMFRLIEYTWGLDDEYTENARQMLQGGFLVAKYHSNREQGSQDYCQAIADTEKIALDMAEKMCADSRNGHPLFYYSADTLKNLNWTAQIARCVGDGTYSGWLCTFQIYGFFQNCLEANEDEKWKSLTPHSLV